MFKRVRSVFRRDGKEPKEPKEKKPKESKEPRRRGFLRKRGGRVAESEVLPATQYVSHHALTSGPENFIPNFSDSQFMPPSQDDGSTYQHGRVPTNYTGSVLSQDHALLMSPGAHSANPTVMVPPPTSRGSTVGNRSGALPNHEPVSLHDFPRVSLVPSTGETHIAYPSSHTTGPHLSGPSHVSRGRTASRRSADMHPYSGDDDEDDGPPLPVPPPARVPTNAASRVTGGTRAIPATARTRSMRNRSASGSPPRSRERRRDRPYDSMRSRTGRPGARDAAGGQVRSFDYAYASGVPRGLTARREDNYGDNRQRDMDQSGLFRRIQNLYSLEHPDFGFSKCTGKKKAVCIGINYIGSSHSLDETYNFPREQIMVLTDDSPEERNQPTQKNIVSALQWLTHDAQPHDSLFIHYSGHGGQIQDQDGDEVDGLDEIIFPVDYQEAGIILDDALHDCLIKPLPACCRLTAVFDSCHSGSVLDLVYLYHSDGRIMGTDVTPQFKQRKMTPAEVICWSGSSDAGLAADASINGLQVGAMSYAFVRALRENPHLSFADLLRDLRSDL
ncbi:caspase domain-containing protein [Vararia minispora EC-137]|uniref:Caspase domain-containing protein n=1 Tax=Vararia minispora EC-137 TaxID=1314806 RepID=A0ACB8QZ42_9AGAM|nr:caspase domain-containing protein [Vararia minispora EC-137]